MNGRILVAGIGNIFLRDDAFGVEVVRRLAAVAIPEGIDVEDFGIRSLDLTYALLQPYQAVILVDAAPRGGAPGTLYVLEIEPEESAATEQQSLMTEMHAFDPVKVLRLARSMGSAVAKLYLVGCEPLRLDEDDDFGTEISPPVQAAVGEAVGLIQALIGDLRSPSAEVGIHCRPGGDTN